ncbi:MAG: response regulator [Bdellovibrionales bacterium]|nr:response regulator [Bdellovibrionales bacterium]
MKTLKNATVLVVDDEDELREIFVDEFRAIGAKVFEARQGVEALEILRREKIDVVLSDVRMPGGDGISLVRNIDKEIRPKPILFLCSGFSEHSYDEVRALGVIDVFGKPFEWNKIVSAIEAALKSSSRAS